MNSKVYFNSLSRQKMVKSRFSQRKMINIPSGKSELCKRLTPVPSEPSLFAIRNVSIFPKIGKKFDPPYTPNTRPCKYSEIFFQKSAPGYLPKIDICHRIWGGVEKEKRKSKKYQEFWWFEPTFDQDCRAVLLIIVFNSLFHFLKFLFSFLTLY